MASDDLTADHEAALEALTVETMRLRKAEAERDDALAEAARLREALSNLLDCVEEGSFSSHEACGSVPAARAALADTEEAKSDG